MDRKTDLYLQLNPYLLIINIAIMKKLLIPAVLFIAISSFSSCELVEGIFKAGVWVGILIVVAVIALIIWLVTRARK